MVDHDKKIRSRKQKTDIGKYSFLNRTIQLWNQLPADALGTLSCKQSNFRKRVRKVTNEAKWSVGEIIKKCSEVEWREGHADMWVHQFMTLHTLNSRLSRGRLTGLRLNQGFFFLILYVF
jgi:hypothetical protein